MSAKLKVLQPFAVNGKSYHVDQQVSINDAAKWPAGSLARRIENGFVIPVASEGGEDEAAVTVAIAQKEAQRILDEAREQAERILEEARANAEKLAGDKNTDEPADITTMTKQELIDYALEQFEVEISIHKSKDEILEQVRALQQGE